jgi:hypothetical protein
MLDILVDIFVTLRQMPSVLPAGPGHETGSHISRVALAVLAATLSAPLLFVLAAIPAALVQGGKVSLTNVIITLPTVMLYGGIVSGSITLLVGLPLYLLVRRVGRARPVLAIGIGALIGAAFLFAVGDPFIGSSLLGAFVGACTGLIFLMIAGRSLPIPSPAQAE